jgi:hypothetical protein
MPLVGQKPKNVQSALKLSKYERECVAFASTASSDIELARGSSSPNTPVPQLDERGQKQLHVRNAR